MQLIVLGFLREELELPKLNNKLPAIPNNEWKDLQFRFDGKWMPDVDPALIGPNNYSKLENLRYKDSGLEGVNGYTKINTTALDGSDATLGNYPYIKNGHQLRSTRTQKTYTLVHSKNSGGQGRVFVNRTDIGSQGNFDNATNIDVGGSPGTPTPYYEDSSSGLTGRFSNAPRGNIAYANGSEAMIYAGDEQSPAAVFRVADAVAVPTLPIDYTETCTNNLLTDYMSIGTSATFQPNFMVLTTRPIQSVYLYLSAFNSETDTTLTCKYWTGSAWSADIIDSDGTISGGAVLAQNGRITFDDHTKDLVKLKHYEELYLYAYLFELTESSGTDALAQVYNITVDKAFQTIENVWDGVYRQPVEVQLYTAATTSWADYTAQANVASEEDNPIGLKLTGMVAATSKLIIMFTEQQAGIRFQMLGGLINKAASVMTVKYWTGKAYAAVGTLVDETAESGITFAKTGLVNWIPNVAEKPRTLFNTFGYAYEITVGTTLTSATEVYADLITGVPASKDMGGYDFTVPFGTRLMLCSPSVANEGNRMDFSVANAPDVYNGYDSSDDTAYSLYFGGEGNLTAASPLYNRFGSNFYSMLLVTKDHETYLLVGDNPDNFVIYPVSQSIGCPAPLTMASGEINTAAKEGGGTTRNVSMWLSASGPIMFDGAAISSIRGIENFFDPNNDEYIEWDSVANARGWMDNVYKEYNLLIPSSASQTTNNKWLVYDLLRKKWYEKKTSTADIPQSCFEVLDTNGERKNYAGIDTGYMMYLENSTSWDGTGITQRVKTGDFFPTSNIWDSTLIRKFKLLTHKFEEVSDTNALDIYYYKNTEEIIGSGVAWISTDDDITGVFIDFEDTLATATVSGNAGVAWTGTSTVSINVNQDIGSQRIINIVQDENRLGWAHAWEFVITTTNVPRGFRPIAWGVQYRLERKDNTQNS